VTISGKCPCGCGEPVYFELECRWLRIHCFRDYFLTFLTLRVGRRHWQLLPEFIGFGLLPKEE